MLYYNNQVREEIEESVGKYLDEHQSDDEDDDDSSSSDEDGAPERKWDCESILSTYSNIYNHPKLISEPFNNKIKGTANIFLLVTAKVSPCRRLL